MAKENCKELGNNITKKDQNGYEMKIVGPSKELRLTIKFLSHEVVYSVVYEKVSFSNISPT